MNISGLASATEKRDGAYEIKSVVPTSVAEAALGWARTHLYRLSIQSFGLYPIPKNGQAVPSNGHAIAGAFLEKGPQLCLRPSGSRPEA